MAWDLWGSSYDQDVIEEDALNEEYCVQVLRILITKADTEIKVLEKDLSSLQNELACAEHEKWPEICCSALTERINWLDVAISALKKDLADEIETGLLLHSKPAETLNEIVKALQRDHCQDENSQVGDLGYASEVGNYADYLGAPNEGSGQATTVGLGTEPFVSFGCAQGRSTWGGLLERDLLLIPMTQTNTALSETA